MSESLNNGNRLKVLIAEDNAVVRKGLFNFLQKWGYEPIEAENGEEALIIIDRDPEIRLAILDWNLPKLNGMQVCHSIRELQSNKYIYIIMFSSRKSPEEQIAALTNGADDYLVKPSKPSLLRARLIAGHRIVMAMKRELSPATDASPNAKNIQ
ncbi:MAG: response regulator [Proteobacteria bacterium]|nr:response regulator [Pseudomonadota bacterium]MBU1716284.1 response regulator [Pseudomonadota bacterium]